MEGDTEPLRNSAAQWSLGGDKQLLGVLQDIHERLVSRCQETNRRLGEMAAALDDAAVDLHNVNNKFMALSNTQFIESRVYEDDMELAAATDTTKEPKLSADATSEVEKIKLGLKVFESMHEPLHILHDTDSESDTEDDEISRMVLKLKDPYAHRPLPFIIGSHAWQNKWHAGLVPEDSDSDSSVRSTKHHSREEYSDSEPESTGNIQTDKLHAPERTVSTASSDMISEQELPSSSPVIKPSPSDIAAELARRLGGHTNKPLEPETEYTLPNPGTKKVYRPEKPATSTVFSDEPPPLEQSYSDREEYSQEEDDDIFAELNKNKPYAQKNGVQNRVSEDLFGGLGKSDTREDNGDIFSDFKEPSKPANQKSTLFSDESEPELFAEKPPSKAVKQHLPQEASSTKKPVGGISLFGNKGTESIGAAILKRNQRQSSTDDDTVTEESPQKQQTNKEKDIFDDLFAKSEKEQRKIEKKAKVEAEVVKEVIKEKKVDLFSDNIFDDIDDIFTSNIPKVPIKVASKNQKSIFDDEDDLFSEVAVAKNTEPQVKSGNIQKSIFDSDDELFSEKTVTRPLEGQKPSVKPITEAKVSKTTGNIFDNSSDNDIFSDVKEPVSIENKPVATLDPEKDLARHKENIKDGTKEKRDNNSDSIKTADEKNITNVENIENSNVYDENDDNDDIFKTKLSTNMHNSKSLDMVTEETHTKDIFANMGQNKTDVPNIISAKSIFDEKLQNDLFNDSPVDNPKQLNKPKVTKSLFDNDSEEELFSNKSKGKDNSQIIQSEPESKSIDVLRNNVFGNTDTNSQNTIKITEGALSTETEGTLLKKENDNFITNSDNYKPAPSKKDVSNIINEEDIDGFFKKSKNIETVTEISKEETDSTVNEGNSDEYDDVLVTDSTKQGITKVETNPTSATINTLFDEKFDDDLFTNISKNKEQKNVGDIKINEVIDKTLEEQEKDHHITGAVNPESLKSDNVNVNILNACQNTIFNEKPDDIEIPPPLSNDFKNDSIFNKSDIFSDVFSEPPEFEKPKEPKKSKNINALFDDDSDDEALFFKKTDPTLDDKPDYSPPIAENRLFGLFHDEPPALDVDFEQKNNKAPNLCDVPKDQVDYNNDITKSETKLKRIEEPAMSGSPKSEKVFLECKAELPVVKRIPDKSNGTESDNIKRVGKLKNMNFSINVNALLPGASPKKIKSVEDFKERSHTKSEVDIRIKDSNLQEIESKLVKSISFEGKPESLVLDNTLSKERVKIQVKRRPSTRRARKEAVRKSAIDFGEDSTDHSSSIDDTSRTDNSENTLKSAMDSEHGYSSLTYDSILDVDDLKSDIVPASSDIFDSPKSEIIPKDSDVKTKTVYILNDEDIFDIEPKSKRTLTIVDDEYPATTNTSKLDANEDLIKSTNSNLEAEITNKNFNDESQTLFTESKSKHLTIIDDDDDLFKINNTGVNTLGKVYKESKSENIDEPMFKSQHEDTRDNSYFDKVTHSANLNEPKSLVNVPVEHQTEHKYESDSTEKTNTSVDKPKEVKKSSLFDLSDEENELFNKNVKSVKKSVFDSDSDEDLFNKKASTAKKESKDVKGASIKVKVDVKASLFGDDDDDDLFGVKTKKSEDVPSKPARSTARDLTSKTTEPAFEDPLSLLGGDED